MNTLLCSFFLGSFPLAALNEKRNCLSIEIVPTRFIQSKIRVVTLLNKDAEYIQETESSEELQSLDSEPSLSSKELDTEESLSQ